MPDVKYCPSCTDTKPVDQFYRNRSRPDGRATYCKKCQDDRTNDCRSTRFTPAQLQALPPAKTEADYQREACRDSYERLKLKVIAHLGGKCPCGFSDPRALHVDHVHNGGRADRKRFASNRAYWQFVLTAPANIYQLLCANCNAIKEWERRRAARQ